MPLAVSIERDYGLNRAGSDIVVRLQIQMLKIRMNGEGLCDALLVGTETVTAAHAASLEHSFGRKKASELFIVDYADRISTKKQSCAVTIDRAAGWSLKPFEEVTLARILSLEFAEQTLEAYLKGHGFSRAEQAIKYQALAPEGTTACISLLMPARAVIVVAAAILCFWSASGARAQHPNAAGEPRPSFEVVSVKPSSLHERSRGLKVFSDGFTSINLPLKEVLRFAYNLRSDDQLAGGPSWINSMDYDIEAKESDADARRMSHLSVDQRLDHLRLMAQSLLADRFKLRVSFRTEQLPAYGLLVAKGGPKLVQTEMTVGNKPAGPPKGSIGIMHGSLFGRGVSAALLAAALSREPELGGRVVVDQTGLQGSYDLKLKWTPEFKSPVGIDGTVEPPNPDGEEAFGPSLFTALEEQLGLKLKSIKSPQQVVVIEHIEKPTPN